MRELVGIFNKGFIYPHLDPEEGEEVVGGPQRPGVLHRVRRHPVPLLADVHPPVQNNFCGEAAIRKRKYDFTSENWDRQVNIAVCSFRVIFNPN